VRVTVQLAGHEPIWSQRNIDVGEPLRPGLPHALVFPVGNPTARPVTVTLGLVNHRPGWSSSLSDTELENLQPGETTAVTLTVTPASDARLGTGFPIVDVEGYVNGVLIGGFRKLDRPPIPIHKPHERSYAETEVIVDPYPPQQGQPSRVGAVVQNTGEVSWTIELEFGWADFGMGIPFTHTGMVPYTRSVTLSPHLTTTAWVTWTPSRSGHQCVQVHSIDAGGAYDPQFSQRNVDVEQRPTCGITEIYTVTMYNDSADQVTVDVGLITFNVPAEWQITVTPSSTLTLPPFGSGVITVALTIPCAAGRAQGAQEHIDRLQQEANSVPTINVEGYVDGQLLGGIQLQFPLSTSVQASFQAAPTEGVAPLTVVFTNTTVGDFDTVLWDLGDGVISTLENPTHTYAVGGVYTVSLTASGMGGTDTLVRARYITVYQPVVAEFSGAPTSGFVPLTVNWTNLSSGDYSTFGWDFGDGSTSAQQNPTHVYTSCGVFTVKLTVTGPGGTDEALREDYISARCGIFLPVLLRGP
jgi:PKD repeat protein